MLLNASRSLVLLVDVQEKLTPLVHEHGRLITHCHWLLDIATVMNIPILVSEQYPQGLGKTVKDLHPFIRENNYVSKISFSCTDDEACLKKIENEHRDHIVLIGIEAHVCILQTAFGLQARGKSVFVVADAVSSRSIEDKKLALKRMRQRGIDIVSREMVVFEWLKQSNTELFKTISKKYLR